MQIRRTVPYAKPTLERVAQCQHHRATTGRMYSHQFRRESSRRIACHSWTCSLDRRKQNIDANGAGVGRKLTIGEDGLSVHYRAYLTNHNIGNIFTEFGRSPSSDHPRRPAKDRPQLAPPVGEAQLSVQPRCSRQATKDSREFECPKWSYFETGSLREPCQVRHTSAQIPVSG